MQQLPKLFPRAVHIMLQEPARIPEIAFDDARQHAHDLRRIWSWPQLGAETLDPVLSFSQAGNELGDFTCTRGDRCDEILHLSRGRSQTC